MRDRRRTISKTMMRMIEDEHRVLDAQEPPLPDAVEGVRQTQHRFAVGEQEESPLQEHLHAQRRDERVEVHARNQKAVHVTGEEGGDQGDDDGGHDRHAADHAHADHHAGERHIGADAQVEPACNEEDDHADRDDSFDGKPEEHRLEVLRGEEVGGGEGHRDERHGDDHDEDRLPHGEDGSEDRPRFRYAFSVCFHSAPFPVLILS